MARVAYAGQLTRRMRAKFRVFAYAGTLWSSGEFYRPACGGAFSASSSQRARRQKRGGERWALWQQTSVRFSMRTVPNGCRVSKSTATTSRSRTRTGSSATRPAAAPSTRCWTNGASRCASWAPIRWARNRPTRCRRSSSTSCWPKAIAEAGGIIHSAIEEFAQALTSVIKRFLKASAWHDTEAIVVRRRISVEPHRRAGGRAHRGAAQIRRLQDRTRTHPKSSGRGRPHRRRPLDALVDAAGPRRRSSPSTSAARTSGSASSRRS